MLEQAFALADISPELNLQAHKMGIGLNEAEYWYSLMYYINLPKCSSIILSVDMKLLNFLVGCSFEVATSYNNLKKQNSRSIKFFYFLIPVCFVYSVL